MIRKRSPWYFQQLRHSLLANNAADVIETLRQLFAVRTAPRFIRSDNGPDFIAQAVRDWLAESGVETLYIEPGSPWGNGYCESLNNRLLEELLNRELFLFLRWLRRPHSSLGYETPAAYAAKVDGRNSEVSKASATPVGTGDG